MRPTALPLVLVCALACGHSYGPPAPPLPPPPEPLGASNASIADAPRSSASDPTCKSATTPDPELAALRIGFCGCRVMGTRLDPAMSGSAVLRATVGTRGEVSDVVPAVVEGLPPQVVSCLVERVRHAHFSPRAATMIVTIPVSFSKDGETAAKGHTAPLPAGSIDL